MISTRWLLTCGVAGMACLGGWSFAGTPLPIQPELGHRSVPLLTVDGLNFKDLDRNARLDPYEDWRLSALVRTQDLLLRMSLEDKAGVMMHGSAPTAGSQIGLGDRYDLAASRTMISNARVKAFTTRLAGDPRVLAEENNKLQQIAEEGPLGIPATISSDPRNVISALVGASVRAGRFSRWPDSTGLAAARDPDLTRHFADTARREYLAVGIRQALSPQVDLASEPRWSRFSGTFGENPLLSRNLARAYVEGMQNGGRGVNRDSVLAVVKHWVGYGAAKDGWDSHNYYGRYARFGGDSLKQHIIPFEGAFDAQVSAVMPTYSILEGASIDGKAVQQVAAGFNHFLLTDLLRGRYRFGGVVISDWLVTSDCDRYCREGDPEGAPLKLGGMPWGVGTLSPVDRFAKAVNAGVDQFGGVVDSALLVEAIRTGKVDPARIDQSVTRILIQKFEQGLFENPYVDPVEAERIVGSAPFQKMADDAQRRSLVLLRNKDALLPLKKGLKVYSADISADALRNHGLVPVDAPGDADVAIVRVQSPWKNEHDRYFFGSRLHEGRLFFKPEDEDFRKIQAVQGAGAVVVVMHLERPAILTNVLPLARGIIGSFGVDDGPLLDIVTGAARPTGKLPFELPSSQEAVLAQRPDIPGDSKDPLFPYGFGLEY